MIARFVVTGVLALATVPPVAGHMVGLRIRNASRVPAVVETRFADDPLPCAEGAAFRTYRLAPGRVWVIPPQSAGSSVCWRSRAETGSTWSAWERVSLATTTPRDLEVSP